MRGSLVETIFSNFVFLKPIVENLKFNLSLFRKRSLKIAFDALYGLHKEGLIFEFE